MQACELDRGAVMAGSPHPVHNCASAQLLASRLQVAMKVVTTLLDLGVRVFHISSAKGGNAVRRALSTDLSPFTRWTEAQVGGAPGPGPGRDGCLLHSA